MLLLFLFYLWYNIIISLHNISPMAPLCKRALRYLGIIKKYVLPRKSIAVFSCILITSLAAVGFVLFPGTSHALEWFGLGNIAVIDSVKIIWNDRNKNR